MRAKLTKTIGVIKREDTYAYASDDNIVEICETKELCEREIISHTEHKVYGENYYIQEEEMVVA